MLTNKGLARLSAYTRATTTTRERNRVAVPRTYTTRIPDNLHTRIMGNGITVIRDRESGLVAAANRNGSHHSGAWSIWRAWSDAQGTGRR